MRGLFLLDHVLRDLQYSIRSISKDVRVTFVAVLALGIGASTVVFSIFYNLIFNAVAARDAQRLVVPVMENAETPEFTDELWISWADVKYLREHNQVFEKRRRLSQRYCARSVRSTELSIFEMATSRRMRLSSMECHRCLAEAWLPAMASRTRHPSL